MLSDTTVTAPDWLIAEAVAERRPARALIVGADSDFALTSARDATEAGLIEPVLVGDPDALSETAARMAWDVGPFQMIPASGDEEVAAAAADALRDPGIGIVIKGHIHTDAMMGALLRKEVGLRTGERMSHVFHMTVPGTKRALMISDGALNVSPDAETYKAIARNLVSLSHAIGIDRPKVAILSATETPLPQMPSSLRAAELAVWAREANLGAKIAGPLAFDNAVSPLAATIKGLDPHPVAGDADALIVPSIETGNALYKMMVYFMGACAAGVVLGGRIPVVITSRADPPAARLASTALAVLGLRGSRAQSPFCSPRPSSNASIPGIRPRKAT